MRENAGAAIADCTNMARFTFLVLPIAWLLGGCLPNPQSEWTSSEGGSQRSTLVDPTILAQSTPPPGAGGFVDFDWGGAFSFSTSDADRADGPRARDRAHPAVGRASGAMAGERHATSRGGGGGHSSGGRRR